jgi:signal transduction histidine kinase
VPERFKEAIFVRKHFKNTGFGLSLSREILGITGLSIRERGTPGEGARFEITIPRQNYRTGDTVP